MKRYAVIDLGTNTFHLLIVEWKENNLFQTLYRHRTFVKLAESGIHFIGEQAFRRGIEAVLNFKEAIDAYKVNDVLAIGTAALRTATNAGAFLDAVYEKTNIRGQVISGLQEATYICKGVRAAIPIMPPDAVIIDIGGGSVEFIILKDNKVVWGHSYPIGVAVLYNQFQYNDPILPNEVNQVEQYLEYILPELLTQLQKNNTATLVGASGAFDVFENYSKNKRLHQTYATLTLEEFWKVHGILLYSTTQERKENPNIPEGRAEMMAIATILIAFLLKHHQFGEIYISDYDLKEGVILSIIE
ncbi:MAG: hypothetical protein KA974_02720 [Saprospiraceae bacterium]|nr:hypothetical protein [Saprospiraceae bacterium]MBP7699617.1 hypothetical protein [Saprospiraceae bacterium]